MPICEPFQVLLKFFRRGSSQRCLQTFSIWCYDPDFLISNCNHGSIIKSANNHSISIGLEFSYLVDILFTNNLLRLIIDNIFLFLWSFLNKIPVIFVISSCKNMILNFSRLLSLYSDSDGKCIETNFIVKSIFIDSFVESICIFNEPETKIVMNHTISTFNIVCC